MSRNGRSVAESCYYVRSDGSIRGETRIFYIILLLSSFLFNTYAVVNPDK